LKEANIQTETREDQRPTQPHGESPLRVCGKRKQKKNTKGRGVETATIRWPADLQKLRVNFQHPALEKEKEELG